MARKGQTEKHKKYLTRVRRNIAAAEKRGYRFDPDMKAQLYSYSTQKLKGLTPEKLYKKATALSETGHIISGTQRRKEEISLARRKAAATRRRKKTPTSGLLIMAKLTSMMMDYNTVGSEYLINLLKSESKKYGLPAVLKALDETGQEALAAAETALIYEEDHNTLHRAFKNLADIINQSAPKYQTNVNLGKTIDKL